MTIFFICLGWTALIILTSILCWQMGSKKWKNNWKKAVELIRQKQLEHDAWLSTFDKKVEDRAREMHAEWMPEPSFGDDAWRKAEWMANERERRAANRPYAVRDDQTGEPAKVFRATLRGRHRVS